ncbi:MAG: TlpA family protein disulfide reductase [Flavisolibacter sp.]
MRAPIHNKITFIIITVLISVFASAQGSVHIVRGSFSEKTLADIWVIRGTKFQRIADFRITPADGNFCFGIPDDSTFLYHLQINFMKPGQRHPEMDHITIIPIRLSAHQNYSLTITPSSLDVAKNKGWQLIKEESSAGIALIKGTVSNVKLASAISLQSVEEGMLVTEGNFMSNNQGSFAIPYEIKKPGFYYLTTPRWQVRLYLDPFSKEEITIDNSTGLFHTQEHSGINSLLSKWQQLIAPLTSYGYNSIFKDSTDLNSYIDEYTRMKPAMDEWTKKIDLTDAKQYEALQTAIKMDRELVPINLLYQLSAKKIKSFRSSPKGFNEVPSFYRQFIEPNKFESTSVLMLGEARQFIQLYAKLNLALVPIEKRETMTEGEKLKLMMNTISNDTLKSFFLKDQMDQAEINNLSEFRETFEPFKNYASLTGTHNTYNSIYNQFSRDTAFIGKTSYDFSLPDTLGKMVTMKDFKGKVVFIDVWATWCGPCKGQFPFLKEIEEEYANNKDIIFVGISLDKAQARQKWLDLIRKEKLGGVQLLDDVGKTFGRKYEVSAIPRFMLIDKEGRWIEIRCPLPEAKSNLKRYLDRALAH